MKPFVCISRKYMLTVSEACSYFGISETTMRMMLKTTDQDIVFMSGAKTLIKRKNMEKYLNDINCIMGDEDETYYTG